MTALTESVVEQAAPEWFSVLGYAVVAGAGLAPGEPASERSSYADVAPQARVRDALARLNPAVSAEGLDEAFRTLTRISSAQPIEANHELHYYLVNGVTVEYLRADGSIGHDPVRVLDFDTVDNNDWLVVNQVSVTEGGHARRPDLLVFVNGLPLALIELKSAISENATIWSAFQQLQTYKSELPSLFVFNELLVVSDGLEARLGTVSSNRERFAPWRTIEGEALAPATFSQLEVLIRGVFDKRRLLDLLRYFIVFEDDGEVVVKKGDTFPCLSDRSNIVVMADEAHRSQYDFIDGFARHMRDALPNASFIGFTGTPIDSADKNTRSVFGDYVSIYDIQRAVEDGATVPIYYESRLAKVQLKDEAKRHLDDAFDELTEGEELEGREKLKTKWSALEVLVGTERRLQLIAQDLVQHFEARLEVMDGKAMVVCMSRRICVDLYDALVALRPDWHDPRDDAGALKIVMTGSASDPSAWQPHIRTRLRREALAKRFKHPEDPLRLVIVRDMWLTGFDAPCLHTMYLDKPMQGHGLMQAIARVNRVFRDKPGGLVVDYLGLADQLKKALQTYTESGGQGETALDQAEAVALMLQGYDLCSDIFHGFDWSAWMKGSPAERLSVLPAAQEHVLAQDGGKDRLLQAVTELSKTFALAVPHEEAIRIRDDVGFFQAVRTAIAKTSAGDHKASGELDHAIRQIVSKAIVSEQVIDIFAAAGLKNPDISILSDQFLADVRGMQHKNLAVELLRKLLNDEVKARSKHNLVQARSFAELLERSVRRYQNRAIEAAQVIEELIELAKDMRAAQKRGEQLGLTNEELAFYDALEVNDSAVKVLGDETLRTIARELVETVGKNVTIDWTVKESVRAKLRVIVKRILRKYGYPPDKQEAATNTVLQQAELLSEYWVEATA